MTVEIPEPDERTQELFQLLFSLHAEFPGHWCLIGGYMVYLLALEAGLPVRQTTDADVLADPAQGLLRKISEHLVMRYGMVAEGGTGSPERHLQDLALLLALVGDPIEFRSQLKVRHRRRLASTALADRSSGSWSHMATELADQAHAALILIGE